MAEPVRAGRLCAGVKEATAASLLCSRVEPVCPLSAKRTDVCRFSRKAVKSRYEFSMPSLVLVILGQKQKTPR